MVICMPPTPTANLTAAHDETAAILSTIPDGALDWQPDETSWSLKRILGHLTHAYEFYLLIVEEARKSRFGTVKLHPDLPGWKRVEQTDAAVLACPTTAEACALFNATHARAIAILGEISLQELDRPFVLDSWRPDVAPVTTTLRTRVLEAAADHLREHHDHLRETLAQWQGREL